MDSPERSWFSWRSARLWYLLGLAGALAGSAEVAYGILRADDVVVAMSGVWWLLAFSCFSLAFQFRRRDQRGYAPGAPDAAAEDVMTLARRGEKIRAIKRYRQQNPGISLRAAKDVIDRLDI